MQQQGREWGWLLLPWEGQSGGPKAFESRLTTAAGEQQQPLHYELAKATAC